MTPEVIRTYKGEVRIWGLSDSSAQLLAQLIRSSITADEWTLGQVLMLERLADELDQGYSAAQRAARYAVHVSELRQRIEPEVEVGRDHPGLNEPRAEAS